MPYEVVTDSLYRTAATAKGGRGGRVQSADGVLDLELGKPGSRAKPKANPETLFAAGYAACFGNAILSLGQGLGLDLSESTVTAEVTLGRTESGVGLAVALTATLPGVEEPMAEKILDAAHERCPYSKATRGNIDVTVTLG